jgi:hypothetical protein
VDQPNILPIPATHVQKVGFARELSSTPAAKRMAGRALDLTIHNTSQTSVRRALHIHYVVVSEIFFRTLNRSIFEIN